MLINTDNATQERSCKETVDVQDPARADQKTLHVQLLDASCRS